MNETRPDYDVTGTQLQQTETSPLKHNPPKKNWLFGVLWKSNNVHDQGSLRMIILFFFITALLIALGLFVYVSRGGYKHSPHGGVVSDSQDCSEIGIRILKQGGNAVDAAVASTMCLGVVNFYITGLGGGGHMLIYDYKKKMALDVIDFYPTVPNSYIGKEIDTSVEGASVGVPGLLKGMWEAHRKYGKLKWKELVTPASNLARQGFVADKNIIYSRSYLNTESQNNKRLQSFLNSLNEGSIISFPDLGATLEVIANLGPEAFYNGSLTMDIVDSVQKANGNMTFDDISHYEVYHGDLMQTKFGAFDVFVPDSSSGGTLLLSALNGIEQLKLAPEDDVSSIVLRLFDILHNAYIKFLENNDAGPVDSEPAASQVLVLDDSELYVGVVSSLNTFLGSQMFTEAGFLLNNALANGGFNDEKRPISFGAPVIAIERGQNCGKRLILGTGDVTIAAQVLTNALLLKYNLSVSIESPRFFINNLPRYIRLEEFHCPCYDLKTITKLSRLMKVDRFPLPYKSVNVIEKNGDVISEESDSRVSGSGLHF